MGGGDSRFPFVAPGLFIEYPALGGADKSECVAGTVKSPFDKSDLYQHIIIIRYLNGQNPLAGMGVEQARGVQGFQDVRQVCIRESIDRELRLNVRAVVF